VPPRCHPSPSGGVRSAIAPRSTLSGRPPDTKDGDAVTADPEGDAKQATKDEVAVASLIWQEYAYRHDLIWRLLFRSTAGAVLLAIAPFTIGDLTQQRVDSWIKVLPWLAVVLIASSTFLLRLEFTLFMPVVLRYEDLQESVFGVKRRERRPNRPDFFVVAVYLWQATLFVAGCVAAVIALGLELGQ